MARNSNGGEPYIYAFGVRNLRRRPCRRAIPYGIGPNGDQAAPGSSVVERDEPPAHRILGELGHAVQAELLHDAPAVLLDGSRREVEAFGDLNRRTPLRSPRDPSLLMSLTFSSSARRVTQDGPSLV